MQSKIIILLSLENIVLCTSVDTVLYDKNTGDMLPSLESICSDIFIYYLLKLDRPF